MSDQSSNRKIWLGVGAATTLILGYLFMRRRRSAQSSSSSSSKGPDGQPLIPGLVFYPTENFWATRPVTKWNFADRRTAIATTSTSSCCSTIVPITTRNGSDELVAIVVVEENLRFGAACEKPLEIVQSILKARNSNNNASTTSLISKYDLDSIVPVPSQFGITKNTKQSNASSQVRFSFMLKAVGNITSSSDVNENQSQSQSLRVFCKFCEKTNSLVELILPSAIADDNEAIAEIVKNIYLTSSKTEEGDSVTSAVTQLVSTVPSSGTRITIPSANCQYSDSETLLLLGSSSSSSKLLTLNNDIENQIKSLSSAESSLGIDISKMTEEEVVASPKCTTTVVNKKLGVEFPAVPNAAIVEPSFAGTRTLAVLMNEDIILSGGGNSSSVANSNSSSMMMMSFELWKDAPESWFTSNNMTKDEIKSHFLREVRMMFLPVTVQPCVGPALLSVCGHEDVASFDAEMDGRRVRFYIFRRPSPGKQQQSGDREILVIRQEADSEGFENVAAPFFRKMMESCLISR